MVSRYASSRPKREVPLAKRTPWLTLLVIFVVALLGQIALLVTFTVTVGQRLDRLEARVEALER